MTTSTAHTTMLLSHGALSAGFASCPPVVVIGQRMRTDDAANAN